MSSPAVLEVMVPVGSMWGSQCRSRVTRYVSWVGEVPVGEGWSRYRSQPSGVCPGYYGKTVSSTFRWVVRDLIPLCFYRRRVLILLLFDVVESVRGVSVRSVMGVLPDTGRDESGPQRHGYEDRLLRRVWSRYGPEAPLPGAEWWWWRYVSRSVPHLSLTHDW